MAQLTFEQVGKDLLIAWGIQLGVVIVTGLGLLGVVVGLTVSHIATTGGIYFGVGAIVLFVGYIIGILASQYYLRRHGFVRGIAIAWLSGVLGLTLPMGALLGFLGIGYLLERDARK